MTMTMTITLFLPHKRRSARFIHSISSSFRAPNLELYSAPYLSYFFFKFNYIYAIISCAVYGKCIAIPPHRVMCLLHPLSKMLASFSNDFSTNLHNHIHFLVLSSSHRYTQCLLLDGVVLASASDVVMFGFLCCLLFLLFVSFSPEG